MLLTFSSRLPHDAVFRDELAKVLVGSYHERFEAAFPVCMAGEGSDDVISLVAVDFKDWYAEGFA